MQVYIVYHRVPAYLRRIIGDYLMDRTVIYPGREGWIRRDTTCGVPQGAVVGPLLWDVGYDWVLRGALPDGVSVICYADDTLVTARGKTYREAAILATAGVAQVVARIRRLGLEVACATQMGARHNIGGQTSHGGVVKKAAWRPQFSADTGP